MGPFSRDYGSKSTVSSESSSNKSEETLEPSPPKKQHNFTTAAATTSQQKKCHKFCSASDVRKYNRKWEEQFPLLRCDEHTQGAFCIECKKHGKSLQRAGGAWIAKPFNNWKKAVEKMRAHS